jgi:hypothetical protein
LVSARVPRPLFAALAYGLALGLSLALNAARAGPGGWARVFDLGPGGSKEAANEYLAGLPALSYGTRFYVDRFAELVPSQPVNVAGHPPGPLLLVHWLGIHGAGGLAALCILAGCACAPLTYALTTTLHGERAARVAALLCALSPLTLLFGVTSYDYVFAALGALAACLLVARRTRLRLLGAAALAVASLMSWALLAVGAWAALVVWRRDGLRGALVVAVGCAACVVGLDAVLAAGWGYDPVSALRATGQVYRESLASRRPYAFWVFGSPVAWGVMLGVPIAAGALRAAGKGRAPAVALAAVIVIAAVAGFTKAETERIWLFLVPLACAAAAPEVRPDRVRGAAALLAAQALAVALLFDTVW